MPGPRPLKYSAIRKKSIQCKKDSCNYPMLCNWHVLMTENDVYLIIKRGFKNQKKVPLNYQNVFSSAPTVLRENYFTPDRLIILMKFKNSM